MTIPPQNPAPPYGGYAAPMSPSDERLWATLIHLGGLFVSFLVPLVGYFVLRDRGPFIRAHTATALNFHLTLVIVLFVGTILVFAIIGIFVLIAAGILALVFSIIAAIKANQGEWYTYPLAIPFVK